MKEEILNQVMPVIEENAQTLCDLFIELSAEEGYQGTDINYHAEDMAMTTCLFAEGYIEFDGDLHELIDNDITLQSEVDELLAEEICKCIDFSETYEKDNYDYEIWQHCM